MAKVIINGKTYDSVESMPPEIRGLFEQMQKLFQQSGQPSPFEVNEDPAQPSQAISMQQNAFVVDGQTYTNFDQLPPEARKKIEDAMQVWDANRNGIPDIIEGIAGMVNQNPTPPSTPSTSFSTSSSTTPPGVTVIGGERGGIPRIVLSIALLIAIGVIVYLLIR